LYAACRILEVSVRTIERWRRNVSKPDGRKAAAARREPSNKLTAAEREQILATCNKDEFACMSPNQIVPALADQGVYIASESSFYRVLRQADQLAHRGKSKAPRHRRPDSLKAGAPNQLWSWDITYLPSTIRGIFYYLYMIMDIYSRKIVGWEVFETESADNASVLIRKTHLREGICGKPIVLHADNGSPMKGATMLSTLQKLGVMPSFSRPSVSNDNAYSEALFKTLKYNTGYPDKPFGGIEQARQWVLDFVFWYNEIHRHSALKFVTPAQRHRQEDGGILAARKALYANAKSKRPDRWSSAIRDWSPIPEVYLNSNKSKRSEGSKRLTA
jgi:transposase InsO family protein